VKTSTALVVAGAVGVAIYFLEKQTATPTVAPSATSNKTTLDTGFNTGTDLGVFKPVTALPLVGQAYKNELLSISRDSRHIAMTPVLAPLIASREACVTVWDRVLHQGMDDGSVRSGLDTDGVLWIVFSAITGILVPGVDDVSHDPLGCLTDLLTEGLRPRV